MLRPSIAVVVALLKVALSFGADGPTPITESPIRLPITESVVTPAAVTELTDAAIFVIEADVPCLVFASRVGYVTITPETGPLRIRGLFADGTRIETRKYTAKHLWIIEPAAKGEVELIVTPQNAKTEDTAVRRTLVVSGGGPRPPPKPVDPVDPVDPVTSFRVIFVKESGSTLSAQQTAIPQAKAVRDYLFAKTTREDNVTGWREYDPQVNVANEYPAMKSLWEAVKPKMTTVPAIVIEVNGKAEILPYPANAAEALVLLKKYGG